MGCRQGASHRRSNFRLFTLIWRQVNGWEPAMRNGNRVFGPDELKVLSQIVASASHQLCSLPQNKASDRNLLREMVAKQAIEFAGADLLNVSAIRKKIVAALAS